MPNDDIQAAHVAWQRTQFERSKIAWEWLQRYMPVECSDALLKFTSINPHMRGAEWWDVLDMLTDSDSHIDIMEPISDAFEEGEWTLLHTYIVYTVLYCSKTFATEYTVPMQVMGVRATIDNNGGLPEGLL